MMDLGTENSGEEMLKMFEQAKSLSKALGFKESGKESFDSGQLAQAMEMYQMFKSMSPPKEDEQKPESKTVSKEERKAESKEESNVEAAGRKEHYGNTPGYYDEGIHTPQLQCLRAAIPFLDHKYRRRVGVFVKLLEMQKLMEMYTYEAANASGYGAERDWRRGMLSAIYHYMPLEKKHMIEIIMKCIDINEIMGKMKEVNKNYGGKY